MLDQLDAISEVPDLDRMALTTCGPISDAAVQRAVLKQVADLSVRFFDFAV